MVSESRTHGREDRKQFPLDLELIAASCYEEESGGPQKQKSFHVGKREYRRISVY